MANAEEIVPDQAAVSRQPDHFISFYDLKDGDITVNTSGHAVLEDGLLTLIAGKKGSSGKVQGSPSVEITLVDTGAKVLRYPYLAIRIKSTVRNMDGKVTCRAGAGGSTVDGSFRYADTGDWQTVVADMTDALERVSDKKDRTGTWQATVKVFPFGSSAGKVNAGETAVIESIAFFKTADSARAYAGLPGMDTGDNDMSGKWLYESFKDPGASYRMMKLLYNFDAAYKTLIDKLYDSYGYGGITTNVTFNNRYLKSDSEFQLLDKAFQYCLDKGMTQLWLYDEYQWPSGSAYGMVTEGNPEYEPYGLARIEKSGSGGSVFELPPEYAAIKHAVLTAPGGEARAVKFTDRTVDIDETGRWTLTVYATYDAWVERDSLNPWQKGRPYVNIMSRSAIAKFISLTHEKYAEKLSTFDSVEAFFTDEPSLFTSNMTNPIHTGGTVPVFLVPWEDSLPAEFEKMHGYSLFEHADSLYGGDSETDKVVRINFYQTVAKLVSENYFGQINEWCQAHGTAGSGHLLLEEKLAYNVVLYGNFLTCMNRMGFAGCDLLQVSPQKIMNGNQWIGGFTAIKLASSSARNMDLAHVLVEYNPEAIEDENFMADPFGTSFAGAIITRMYGADKFVMLNPQESYNTAQSRKLNECVGRLNVLLEGARMNSGIGVYYPIAAVQARTKADTVYEGEVTDISEKYNELCLNMLLAGYDYNYIDDESILNGSMEGGRLICGRTAYSVIVMAWTEAMDPAVLVKLGEFENAGGRLIWVDGVPEYSTVFGMNDAVRKAAEKYKNGIVPVYKTGSFDKLAEALKGSVSCGFNVDAASGLLISPYSRDGRQLVVAVNPTPSRKNLKVSFGGDGTYDVYDLYTGEVTEAEADRELLLDGYRGIVLVREGAEDPEPLSSDDPGSESRNGSGNFPLIPVLAGAGVLAVGAAAAAVIVKTGKNKKNKREP
ncbi:MAG: hypothetical protein IJM24_08355 [Clostridia bacterium]|nr:hypothetical protein [Clostridia bacterium]